MGLRVLAVADDLSGAHDCAARLAQFLGPVPTARDESAFDGLDANKTLALVLDAETRHLKPREARWRSARVWQALSLRASAPLRFQKIDSTLRGNPGEDIEGLALATAAPWVAVLAAYPGAGRQTLGGRHFVKGIPLLQSEYARDPLSAAKVSGPQHLFPARLTLPVPLAWVKSGPARLSARLHQALKQKNKRFVTFDCETDLDVDSIAKACLRAACRHFAGSAALAGSLARLQDVRPPKTAAPPRDLAWIGLMGSVSEQNFVQLRQAEAAKAWRWFALSKPWDQARLRAAFRQGPLVLSTLPGREALRKAASAKAAHAAGEAALGRLVKTGRGLVAKLDQAGWLLAGGHTALRFLEAAGLTRFDVYGEALPGVALGQAVGAKQKVWVATKPGGFGQADVLSRFLDLVKAR